MKAITITEDKSLKAVLSHLLSKFGVESSSFEPTLFLETVQPAAFDDVVVLVDVDQNHHLEQLWRFSGRIDVLFFGNSRPSNLDSLYNPPTGTAAFIRKPFDEKRLFTSLNMILERGVLADLDLPPLKDTLSAAEMTSLNEVVEFFAAEAKKVAKILNSTPEQLGGLIQSGQVTVEELPLKASLIVDKDATIAATLSRYLTTMSVLEIQTTNSGLEGWQSVKKSSFDLVVMDWGIDDISGLALYNRLRSQPNVASIPVIVTAGTNITASLRLVRDNKLTQLLHRGSQKVDFQKAVTNAVVAAKLIAKLDRAIYDVFEESLGRIDIKALSEETKAFFLVVMPSVSDYFIKMDKLKCAEEALRLVWQIGDKTPEIIARIGKVYHCQKWHHRAARLLAKADILAPGDIQKICLRGEINIWLKNFDEALGLFQTALGIDLGSRVAKDGQNLALNIAENTEAEDLSSGGNSTASPLNTTGIYLARRGQFEDALSYYFAAFSFVHSNMDRAKILFNIGLCYKRAGREEEAVKAFQRSISASDGKFVKGLKFLTDSEDQSIEFETFQDFDEKY